MEKSVASPSTNRNKLTINKLLLSLIALFSFSLPSHADQALGTAELPQFAPDGQTPLHIVADGTANGTLVGGSRYIGWLNNPAQGFLFDRITRQSWYIYCQYGEPGSGRISWYAATLPDPMPEWVDAIRSPR